MIACLASVGALAVVAAPALSAPSSAAQNGNNGTNGTGGRPTIHPRRGKPFAPTLGDWEGTAGGFPASFSLRLTKRAGVPGYGFGDVVALRPDQCPTAPYRYSEAVIHSKRSTPLGNRGSLGLTGFGYGGSFAGARSATMSARYRAGSCSGTLTWHMHPATRAPVDDGVWLLRFAGRQSGSFRVLGDGRLATSIKLPAALASCNGAAGAVDLFIGASGLAKVSQPNVRVSIQFGRRSATGRMNTGGKGCAGGPLHLTASLK